MKNEMDLMKMTGEKRLCWLLADRVILMTVGAVWLFIILWQVLFGGYWLFFALMVPVFALFRLIAYRHYRKELAGKNLPAPSS